MRRNLQTIARGLLPMPHLKQPNMGPGIGNNGHHELLQLAVSGIVWSKLSCKQCTKLSLRTGQGSPRNYSVGARTVVQKKNATVFKVADELIPGVSSKGSRVLKMEPLFAEINALGSQVMLFPRTHTAQQGDTD